MSTPPNLLNDDGSASMATALMMSHHAFRRDIARFATALREIDGGDTFRVGALRDEWRHFRGALHGHHNAEDTGIFPHLRSTQPTLIETIDQLVADHRRIDPLLEQGDAAFADLPKTEQAAALIAELAALLEPHLDTEEAQVIPFLREAKAFPPSANEEEENMYAQGFAWASHGVAADILERVYAMLPEKLRARLPAVRAAYDERCVRAWGSAKSGASRTPIPDWLAARRRLN